MAATSTSLTDKQMREPLFDYLEEFYGKIRILEEKNVKASRADVIGIVDGQILGFEIKSDRDSYTRLKTQTADYDRFCDYNYLVIGKSHLLHAHEHIPPHWGILVAERQEDGDIRVTMDTLPALNEGAEIKNQLGFLWRPELQALLAENELPVYKAKSKDFVRDKLLEKVPEDKLKAQITACLFERDYNAMLEEIHQVRLENAKKRGRKTVRKSRVKRRRTRKLHGRINQE